MSLHLGSLARSLDYTCPFTVLLKCVAQLTLPFGNCLNNCLIAPLYTQSLHSELYVRGGGLGRLGLARSLIHHYILQVWRATDLYLALKW